jgi:hypothetical protein
MEDTYLCCVDGLIYMNDYIINFKIYFVWLLTPITFKEKLIFEINSTVSPSHGKSEIIPALN